MYSSIRNRNRESKETNEDPESSILFAWHMGWKDICGVIMPFEQLVLENFPSIKYSN